jgi:hypothetical protein
LRRRRRDTKGGVVISRHKVTTAIIYE